MIKKSSPGALLLKAILGKGNYVIDGAMGMNPAQRMQKHVKLIGFETIATSNVSRRV
jgi:hypothetical protein